ncbi:cytochrome b-c1 complex subunit 8-like [Saccostrea echinata]|uniref:cytochrome b-c1 complex subunit 8-like n=1 Tax=Saccostrea echinata TaxID=191078 RepID=UPI002A824717|nr:cytochrome b-c1 complex subunit 8-like [Saccostrea echinata]
MGRHFFNMKSHGAGFVEYNLSPFEQRAFGGMLKHGIANTAARFGRKLHLLIPFYVYYKWQEYCFWAVEQSHRKKNLPEYEEYFASLKEQK